MPSSRPRRWWAATGSRPIDSPTIGSARSSPPTVPCGDDRRRGPRPVRAAAGRRRRRRDARRHHDRDRIGRGRTGRPASARTSPTCATSWHAVTSWPRSMTPTARSSDIGATVDTGRARHLADLFVRTDRQGGGIGGHLLDAVFGDAWPRTTFASDDPRALPLYVRAGMLAYWPNLYLTGDPTRIAPDPDPTYEVEPASLEAVADLEAGWAGVDRSPDLGYWATLPAVRPFVVRAGGRIVGAGIGRNAFRAPMRWMHEAVAAPDADGPAVLLAALGYALAGQELGGACVPGASPLVRRLLDLGFRVRDRDTFLASDAALVDPLREIVNTRDPLGPGRPTPRAGPGASDAGSGWRAAARRRTTPRRPGPASRSARRSGCRTRSTSRRSCGPRVAEQLVEHEPGVATSARRCGSRR